MTNRSAPIEWSFARRVVHFTSWFLGLGAICCVVLLAGADFSAGALYSLRTNVYLGHLWPTLARLLGLSGFLGIAFATLLPLYRKPFGGPLIGVALGIVLTLALSAPRLLAGSSLVTSYNDAASFVALVVTSTWLAASAKQDILHGPPQDTPPSESPNEEL